MRLVLVYLIIGISFLQASEFPHTRNIDKAKTKPGWKSAETLQKLELIRNEAAAHDIASKPVSDRYSITFLGGPIDWVHFLNLSIQVYSGDRKYGEAQYQQWLEEGGPDYEKGRNMTYPSAATPDDLPSNALGALFAKQLLSLNQEINLVDELLRFIKPLQPVPDSLVKQYSRQEIVLGLSHTASNAAYDRAYAWFSAEPLNVSFLINDASMRETGKPFAVPVSSGRVGLARAGLRLISYRGKVVVIEQAR